MKENNKINEALDINSLSTDNYENNNEGLKLPFEELIESESLKLKNNLNFLESETNEAGGVDELEKIWNEIKDEKKSEIIQRMNKFQGIKEKGIKLQLIGEQFLDPRDLGFGEWRRNGNVYERILGPLAYMSGLYPTIGGIFEVIGGIPKLYGHLRSELEKRKLIRLNKEDQ